MPIAFNTKNHRQPISVVIVTSGYRIESAGMKGVAFQQPSGNEPGALENAVAADGFQGIRGARGMKTAAGTYDRRNE